jgi:hypothetical protein
MSVNLSILIFLLGPEEQLDYRISSFVLNDPSENAAFLPFGSGARACVGQKFVIQVVATLLASLLKKYEVRSLNYYSCSCDFCYKKNLMTSINY